MLPWGENGLLPGVGLWLHLPGCERWLLRVDRGTVWGAVIPFESHVKRQAPKVRLWYFQDEAGGVWVSEPCLVLCGQ